MSGSATSSHCKQEWAQALIPGGDIQLEGAVVDKLTVDGRSTAMQRGLLLPRAVVLHRGRSFVGVKQEWASYGCVWGGNMFTAY